MPEFQIYEHHLKENNTTSEFKNDLNRSITVCQNCVGIEHDRKRGIMCANVPCRSKLCHATHDMLFSIHPQLIDLEYPTEEMLGLSEKKSLSDTGPDLSQDLAFLCSQLSEPGEEELYNPDNEIPNNNDKKDNTSLYTNQLVLNLTENWLKRIE